VRLIGAAQVRNEADIIEAFVRHNLSRLDGLLIIDHRSDDRTRDILAALAREGLPLALTLDDDPAQRQPRTSRGLPARRSRRAPTAWCRSMRMNS
jgi:hypothetical protein